MSTPKQVFITGVTGSLGSALAPLYLNEPGTRVYALIRAKSDEHLAIRTEELFAFWGSDVKSADARARFIALRGNAAAEHFGLPEETYTALTATITHIIHSAATIKLNMGEEEAIQKVLKPSQQAVAFARACHAKGQLQKLEYVSTVGVAGKMRGLVPETPLPDVTEFNNNYERFKSQAESRVLAEIATGLPATLHRPSMVIGDSRTGKIIHFQGFYFLCEFLAGTMTGGFLPRFPDVRIDLVPSDYVAKAIYASSNTQQSIGKLLHLSSGPEHAIPVHPFAEMVHAHFRKTRKLAPLRVHPAALYVNILKIVRLFVGGPTKKAIRNLFVFSNYMDACQRFENRQSDAFLSAHGVPLPDPKQYLPVVLDYYLAHKPRP